MPVSFKPFNGFRNCGSCHDYLSRMPNWVESPKALNLIDKRIQMTALYDIKFRPIEPKDFVL